MKNSALLIICLLSFSFFQASSQQLFFPKRISADSAALARSMPGIAKEVMNQLAHTPKEKRDRKYFERLFPVQTIAGMYKESLKSIDSLRLSAIKEAGLPEEDTYGLFNIYEIHDHIKLLKEEGDARSETELLKWSLPTILGDLKGKALTSATEPFLSTPATITADWQQALAGIQAEKTDSISLDKATLFTSAYLRHQVYDAYLNPGKEVLAVLDNSNFIIQDSTMITMRDGAKIAAVIVRSKKAVGPQPVVMIATIYASMTEVQTAKEIQSHGYVGIILNSRGKYVSDDPIEPWEHEAEDIYDAIDWISKQPWCNGKVGMYGGSYRGFCQWAAAKKLHPALKTIVPQVAVAPGIDFPVHNGIHTNYLLSWIHLASNNKLSDDAEFADANHWNETNRKWSESGKPFNRLDSIEGRPNPIFQKWLKHPLYDAYWQKMTPYQQEFSKINIPVLTITGYFDVEQLGALHYYKEHYRWNPSANHYLLIGPYDHPGSQGTPSPVVNGYKIDRSAQVDITKLVFQWFDFTLKNGTKPELLKDKVNYQIMGANKWGHTATLKDISDSSLKFYFSEQQNGRYHQLSTKPTAGSISQSMDFSHRTLYNAPADSLDNSGNLIFVSDVLKDDIIINGSFTGKLYTSINKKDMDIYMSLIEQQPNGKYFTLSTSLQRASSSGSTSVRTLLTPGKIAPILAEGPFISRKVLKGSKLIISLGIINTQNAEINYGTGGDVARESVLDAKIPLQIKWFGNSLITIPVKQSDL